MNPSHTVPISHHEELVALVAHAVAGPACGANPSMPRLLDVSVPEQRCSSCYLGRLWPQKYLVSSHSVKWN
ncbi:PREDICTED: putative uncharacterized protein C16orf47 homolog [Pygoscelis adeliae]|uniref:putative uncharacterized protein C16orf47 homolog n=1 Tax=Pygoscelis adeliae TaxID=9238 RepID=UPI0004F5016C|nr:PREDICTED: putative uncharacterized protein C16orf47 homolog [Pygoscelis adeliae]